MKRFVTILMFVTAWSLTANAQSQVVREDVEGIVNFARIETTVACAGAITPQAALRAWGYASRSGISALSRRAIASWSSSLRFFMRLTCS